jgi:nitric oxide reductase NorD protein
MNRVRALIVRSSRRLARPLASAAGWLRARREKPVVTLDSVRRRLELLLAAMYESQFEITARDAHHAHHAHRSIQPHGQDVTQRPGGTAIRLPAAIDASGGVDAAVAHYRLLAIEQAARMVRGSAALAPDDSELVACDLYNLCESARIDASIVRAAPGVAAVLTAERTRALVARPSPDRLSAQEREVELRVRSVLASDAAALPSDFGAGPTPADSLVWARDVAASVSRLGGEYRPRPPVGVWGSTLRNGDAGSEDSESGRSAMTFNSPGVGAGTSTAPNPGGDDTLQELSPTGTDTARSDTVDAVDAVDEEQQHDDRARGRSSDDTRVSGAPVMQDGSALAPGTGDGVATDADAGVLPVQRASGGIPYPEWDCNAGAYRDPGAVVRAQPAGEGDVVWAERVLDEHPAVVRRVRREFERLRARRLRMLRQREGTELDLAACVRALADATAGDSSDDQLYMAVRAARRAIAIAVLVDASGSTREQVPDGRRVIDVEKTTSLLASEAFDALGDRYGIFAFASAGAADVRVATVKGFSEPNGERIRRRISAIEPSGNTRLGAAIRHATAVLSAQKAGHRLLLMLSDGKPSDVDGYFTKYAVEDSRRAIFEARSAGLYPFCLTIDTSDPDPYLARIFGVSGYTILRRPEQLPVALLDLVRQLLRGGGAGR